LISKPSLKLVLIDYLFVYQRPREEHYDYKHCCVQNIVVEKFHEVKLGIFSTTAHFIVEKVI